MAAFTQASHFWSFAPYLIWLSQKTNEWENTRIGQPVKTQSYLSHQISRQVSIDPGLFDKRTVAKNIIATSVEMADIRNIFWGLTKKIIRLKWGKFNLVKLSCMMETLFFSNKWWLPNHFEGRTSSSGSNYKVPLHLIINAYCMQNHFFYNKNVYLQDKDCPDFQECLICFGLLLWLTGWMQASPFNYFRSRGVQL